MRIGYARCSTDKQDLTAQREALLELGVEADDIYLDHGYSGSNRERPDLDKALVVPKLDRLARSVPDARAIGDNLVARSIQLQLGTMIYDPTDPMGKMFFNILASFAEFEVDLLRMRTREGMAIAKAKGKLKGRAPKLSAAQQTHLLKLHAAGEHTVVELAELFGVARPTVYRVIDKARAADAAVLDAVAADLAASGAASDQAGPQRLACPGCGAVPNGKIAAARLREELQTEWWSTTGTAPARIQVTHHCGRCQPHTVYALACLACGDGPLLTGQLAEVTHDTELQELPAVVTSQLTASGWQWATTSYGAGWVCRRTACESAPTTIGAAR
jgi:DNA invertase Pin-like site-specific DNA recombinase